MIAVPAPAAASGAATETATDPDTEAEPSERTAATPNRRSYRPNPTADDPRHAASNLQAVATAELPAAHVRSAPGLAADLPADRAAPADLDHHGAVGCPDHDPATEHQADDDRAEHDAVADLGPLAVHGVTDADHGLTHSDDGLAHPDHGVADSG